jgi:putative peptidoglycan lipid II flippase
MNQTDAASAANRQIARAAGTVMFAILLGQVTGLIRGILVARAFGASPELDSFIAANRVSETLFLLVAGGALGSAFIPTFTGFLAKKKQWAAWQLASSLANAVTLSLCLLAAVAALFAPQIVRYLLAPGLARDPSLFKLTIDLLRIQLISAVLFGLGGLVTGILNAHQIFFIPALTPAMYQLGIIFGVLVLTPSIGVFGLAWGVVIGATLYLLIQIPVLFRQSGTYSLTLGLGDPSVREVIRLMGPRLLGVAVVQLNFWVNIWLASQMAEGSVTGLSYGFSLMLMAQAAIAQSVAIAAMPTFSAQYALGKLSELRATLVASLRGVILLALPASAGLILLRQPLVGMLYQRGAFDARSTDLVAWALLWYAAGLVGHSVLEVLTRAFYAQHDTKTPVIVGMLAMGLNVLLSVGFASLFQRIGWMPHGGLALANSLATALEATTLFILMQRRLKGLGETSVGSGFAQAALGTLGMSLVVLWWRRAENPVWLIGLGGVVLGGMVYALAAWAMRVPELMAVLNGIARRLKRAR